MSPILTNLNTLRSEAHDLLPRTTILVYGTNVTSLDLSLQALSSQTNENFDVMLLHDGPIKHRLPSDRTRLRRLSVQWLEMNRPCGKSHAVNSVLDRITSEYVLLLDGGDLIDTTGMADMVQRLHRKGQKTAGVYGDLELWVGNREEQRYLATRRGEPSGDPRRLIARIGKQLRIAPPLIRMSALRSIEGCPTDYPGEGWLLPDTALALALLQAGSLDYHRQLYVRRSLPPRDARLRHDERKITQVLVRQAVKRLDLLP